MEDKKNENTINSFLDPSLLSNVSQENQSKVLEMAEKESRIKAGLFGRVFGTNSELASKYITFLILFVLLLFLIVDFIVEVIWLKSEINEKISSWIISIISLGLGYLFGKK